MSGSRQEHGTGSNQNITPQPALRNGRVPGGSRRDLPILAQDSGVESDSLGTREAKCDYSVAGDRHIPIVLKRLLLCCMQAEFDVSAIGAPRQEVRPSPRLI